MYEGLQVWLEWYKEWQWPNYLLVGLGLLLLFYGNSLKALAPEKYIELSKLRAEKRHQLMENDGFITLLVLIPYSVFSYF